MRTHRRLARASLLPLCVLIPIAAAPAQTTDTAAVPAGHSRAVSAAPQVSANRIPAGASLFTLDSTEIMASGGESFSAVLQARVPGLSVLRSGGSAAEGSRVQLRGPHSILMTTEPIVIIDGIRVNAMQESSVIDVGVRTSRLDDIAPEDVARVDVLPGPAAASLFGPGAAGGALVITTKRGDSGPLRWSGRAESRLGTVPDVFPANYRRRGIATATGQPTTNCDLVTVASGACTPTGLDVWNPLEQASRFRTARTAAGNMSLAGGVRQTSARLSASGSRTLGVTGDDDAGRLGLRANVAQRLTDAIDLGLHGGYMRTSAGLPWSGNNNAAGITSGLFGSATDDTLRGYREPYVASGMRQRGTHWLAGGSAAWRPRSWLTATAVYGRDELHQHDARDFGGPASYVQQAEVTHAMTTTGVTVAASYGISERMSISGQSSGGYERLGSALDAKDSVPFAFTSIHYEWTFSGPWVRQQLAWRDRLVVGAGLRQEHRKAYGGKAPSATFKSADASWSLGAAGPVEGVRLRAAYGEGGMWIPGDPAAASQPGTLLLDPYTSEPVERTAESELGTDARWGDHLTFSLTAFRSDGSKLYVPGYGPPSVGFGGSVAAPAGRMRNEGLEASVTARLIDRDGVRWDATVTAGTLRNRVRELGVPSFMFISSYAITRPGDPLESYFVLPYTYADANRDGIIDTSEVHVVGNAAVVGSSLPTREAGLHSTLSLPGHLTAGVLLDYRGGQKLLNQNEYIRCTAYRNCRAAQDPTAPLADQARAVVARLGNNLVTDSFIDDASFVKLRELSLTWKLPAAWAVTLAGRNLATWTKYPGLDPELDFRPIDQLPRVELGKSPLAREVILRLDVGGGARR